MKKWLFVMGVLVSNTCFAFDLDGLVDRVTQKAEKKVENKVENTADDITDSVIDGKKNQPASKKQTTPNVSSTTSQPKPTNAKREALIEIKALRDEGLISESEYTAEKKKILSQ